MIIHTHELTKKYGDLTAVDRVSLTVDRGELVGIIGPDGAGKTTFLRMLAGALEPTGGSLTIDGKTFARDRRELKSSIGYLSQVSQAYGDLTVWENIEFFARIRKVVNWQERGENLLRFARLNEFKDRLADQLSGGMRQKLGVCCAVIHQPRILILDEPTTGVDPVSRRELWMILASFLKDSMTILVSTPYLGEAERCSRIGLFDKGRLLMYDTAAAIIAHTPLEVYEIVTANLKATYDIVAGSPHASHVMILGDRINVVLQKGSEGDVEGILRAVHETVDARATARRISASLDNVFASLIAS